jgi:hypothetical protein
MFFERDKAAQSFLNAINEHTAKAVKKLTLIWLHYQILIEMIWEQLQ